MRRSLPVRFMRSRLFGLLALGIAAVALGNARGAIEDLVELAGGKQSLGSRRTLAERHSAQSTLAVAEANLRSARAFFYEAVDEAWQLAPSATAPSRCGTCAALRLAAPPTPTRTARPMPGAQHVPISAAARRCFLSVAVTAPLSLTATSPPSTSWSRRRPMNSPGASSWACRWTRPRRCELTAATNLYTLAPASASARHARSGFPAGCRGRG